MRGTPFIYYGEEIGMPNVKIERKEIMDPLGKRYWPIYSGRDSARTPMRWTNMENAGFSNAKPWLPIGNDLKKNNVYTQLEDPESILNVYKRLLALRKNNEILQKGKWVPVLKGQKGVLVYYRDLKKERIMVALNFTAKPKSIYANNGSIWKVLFSTHKKVEDILCRKTLLEPYEALVVYHVPKKKMKKL